MMIINLETCQTLEDVYNILSTTSLNLEDFGNNFKLIDVFQFLNIGNLIYDCYVREQNSLIDKEVIVHELSLTFPEIVTLNRDDLFPESKKPKNWDTWIIEALSNFYKSKIWVDVTSQDVLEHDRKYKLVYPTVKNYWDNIRSKIEPIDKKFERINGILEEKFRDLEKYPKAVEAFEMIEQIKENTNELINIKLQDWKKENQFSHQNKEDVFRFVDEIYPQINDEICEKMKITDEDIKRQVNEISGVNKEMIKFGLSLELMINTF